MEQATSKDATALIEEAANKMAPLLGRVAELEAQIEEANAVVIERDKYKEELDDALHEISNMEYERKRTKEEVHKEKEINIKNAQAQTQKSEKHKKLIGELQEQLDQKEAELVEERKHEKEMVEKEVEIVRKKQQEHVAKLERDKERATAENHGLKEEIAKKGYEVEAAKAEHAREASENKQAQRELLQMKAQRDDVTKVQQELQSQVDDLKDEKSDMRQKLTEASKALRELQNKENRQKQEHQNALEGLKSHVENKVDEVMAEYKRNNQSQHAAKGQVEIGWLPPPPPSIPLHEQHIDLISMMLNNELVMIEEKIVAESFQTTSDSAQAAGTVALWLQQIHLFKRCLLNIDAEQLAMLDTALDAEDIETLLQQDTCLALAHAHTMSVIIIMKLCEAFSQCFQVPTLHHLGAEINCSLNSSIVV